MTAKKRFYLNIFLTVLMVLPLVFYHYYNSLRNDYLCLQSRNLHLQQNVDSLSVRLYQFEEDNFTATTNYTQEIEVLKTRIVYRTGASVGRDTIFREQFIPVNVPFITDTMISIDTTDYTRVIIPPKKFRLRNEDYLISGSIELLGLTIDTLRVNPRAFFTFDTTERRKYTDITTTIVSLNAVLPYELAIQTNSTKKSWFKRLKNFFKK